MLGQYNLLPLLKGWEYKAHKAERSSVVRGADPIETLSLSEIGWLIDIDLITDDAYGTAMVELQGADLETRVAVIYPEIATLLGSFQADPAGYLSLYRRPNPHSTAGAYDLYVFSGGCHGAIFPYYPTVKVKLYLPNESTQESAYICAVATVIAITDKKAFINSLRRVLDPKLSLDIDPALFVSGPAEFKKEGAE